MGRPLESGPVVLVPAPDGAVVSPAGDDRRLIERIGCGSAEAFELLYDRYAARAYRVAMSVCHDRGRAEDAVQEAFMSVWRRPTAYRAERGSVATWLLFVVRYRAIDVARANKRHADRRAAEDKLQAHPAPGGVSERVLIVDDGAHIRLLLGSLPNVQQEVIALAFYGELTHAEIARHLNLPSGTVKGRMRLGLKRLRAQIEQAAA